MAGMIYNEILDFVDDQKADMPGLALALLREIKYFVRDKWSTTDLAESEFNPSPRHPQLPIALPQLEAIAQKQPLCLYSGVFGHTIRYGAIQLQTIPCPPCGLESTPPWFKTVSAVPPGEILTRTQPIQHSDVPRRIRTKKPSKMYKPTHITYEEDGLRENFYSDHPWELARPRVILEQDGKDGQKCDWSNIQQPARELNGESVIQRQLWLLKNKPGMTSAKAYDQARHEFYAIRHQEDVERRVAKEEALATGAYFGKSMLEIGMELEDKTYESWKAWAKTEVEVIEQQRSAQYTGTELVEEAAVEGAGDEATETAAVL
ncbi:hypothetical protein V494_01969 [Pseudogymnoascus sp. VKM F-4513 (FW-928)]|nr:hypothetical protein V494_01969 [Pseudogymnoascus sp. VKM F-4513 (FW-928)]